MIIIKFDLLSELFISFRKGFDFKGQSFGFLYTSRKLCLCVCGGGGGTEG